MLMIVAVDNIAGDDKIDRRNVEKAGEGVVSVPNFDALKFFAVNVEFPGSWESLRDRLCCMELIGEYARPDVVKGSVV